MIVHVVHIRLSPVNSEVFITAVNSINIKDTNNVYIINDRGRDTTQKVGGGGSVKKNLYVELINKCKLKL